MHQILRRTGFFIIPVAVIAVALLFVNYILDHRVSIKRVTPTTQTQKQIKKISVTKKTLPEVVTSKDNTQDSIPSIVIDAAHGGEDIGIIGYKSIVESNTNLQFAFQLARSIRMHGIKVFLTRMEDKNIPLEERFLEAKKNKALLYISINCAFSDDKNLKGMNIYGFTPEHSQENAEALENKSYEFYEGEYLAKNERATEFENRASYLLKKELGLPKKGALERRFLKNIALPPDVPAVAFYIGYISNNNDAKHLEDPKYVEQLSEKMAQAIKTLLTKTL